jgi:hypothetical protein
MDTRGKLIIGLRGIRLQGVQNAAVQVVQQGLRIGHELKIHLK